MKGTFFQKPLEYNLEVEGESWSQGDQVKGSLSIKSHDGSAIEFEKLGVHLCFVEAKKHKAQKDDAFEFIQSSQCSSTELDFCFDLDKDCPITEASKSLYLLCGDKNDPYSGGLLELNIVPTRVILSFIETFENFFRFKFKKLKNKKGHINVKLVAPSAKEWSNISGIDLMMKMSEADLELIFNFKIKKVSYEDSTMQTKDVKLEITRNLSEKEHSIYGDSTNSEGIKKAIEEVLDQVRLKPVV